MEKKEDIVDDLRTLELQTSWDGQRLVKYDDLWYPEMFFRSILSTRNYFKAEDSDIILATLPKSGTTWLKALTFSIVNRNIYSIDQSPLLASNPHKIVPFLEECTNPEDTPSPRIFSTHYHFNMLPYSVSESESCRIIYLCRNPLDQFISSHHFFLENKIVKDAVPIGLEKDFDMFCNGIHGLGPFWENMLGYWNAHLKNPEKVLFLKYEDLKKDIIFHVKRIAEFMGCPFTPEEENEGLIEEISRLCSFENLKNLEANKNGYAVGGLVKNSLYFRKGEVGDWTNYLTSAMAERMKKLMEIKFEGSSLVFR